MTAAAKDELTRQLKLVRQKLNRIEDAERAKQWAAMLGKCWKYRNNYSCPKKPSDYWFLYVRLDSVKASIGHCLEFQTDRDGMLRIGPSEAYHPRMLGGGGYAEITPREFSAALAKAKASVTRLK